MGGEIMHDPKVFAREREHMVTSLGVSVTPCTSTEVLALIEEVVSERTSFVIAGHNLHSVYLAHTEPDFRAFYEDEADLVLVDGRPVLALLNRQRRSNGLGAFTSDHRVGSTDWLPTVLASGAVERVCVLGATTSSNQRFCARMRAEYPAVELMGIPGDPWNNESIDEVAERVRGFAPELVLIGLGMPLQERVARQLAERGVEAVIATVGGAIDQLSGQQSLAPRWIGRMGLEWAYRLVRDPKRLAHRYCIEPLQLAGVLRERRRAS